jgi:L-xylulokinase
MLRAVAEGVAFNHRSHMDALATRVSLPSTIRVGGGGARSAWWTQLLCDSLGKSTEVTESLEVSALGAAVLAGTGVGAYPSLDCGVAMTVRVKRRHDPNPDMHALLDARYTRYREIVDSLGRILVYEPDTSP